MPGLRDENPAILPRSRGQRLAVAAAKNGSAPKVLIDRARASRGPASFPQGTLDFTRLRLRHDHCARAALERPIESKRRKTMTRPLSMLAAAALTALVLTAPAIAQGRNETLIVVVESGPNSM